MIEKLKNYNSAQLRTDGGGEGFFYECEFDVYGLYRGTGPLPTAFDEFIAIYCPDYDDCLETFELQVNLANSEWNSCLVPCASVGLGVTALFSGYGASGGGPAGFAAGFISGAFFGTIAGINCAKICDQVWFDKCALAQNEFKNCCG